MTSYFRLRVPAYSMSDLDRFPGKRCRPAISTFHSVITYQSTPSRPCGIGANHGCDLEHLRPIRVRSAWKEFSMRKLIIAVAAMALLTPAALFADTRAANAQGVSAEAIKTAFEAGDL